MATRIFNDEFSINEIPSRDRAAFKGGQIEKRLFPAGHELYKFSAHPLVNAQGRVSEYWSSVEPLGPGDPGLAGAEQRAQNLGVASQSYARSRSAVTKQWNAMDRLVRVKLAHPTWGFVGRCAAQRVDATRDTNVVHIGGAWQLWIPNLTRADVLPVIA